MNLTRRIHQWWRNLRGRPIDEHEQQLMKLYWNRAELKKELSDLQEERQALISRVESHQAAIRRAGEQVDELAAYLGRPEVGAQALLYFQLRALWFGHSTRLKQFVTDLRTQQEDRERRKHKVECEARRAAQVAEMDERLLNAQSIADSLSARYQLLAKKLASLKWFWHYWKRREVRAQLAQAHAQWEIAATNVTDLSDERAAVAGAPLEEYTGLTLEGRRIVNTAAIAFAEWLILNLPQRTLAPLTRHAISVQIFDAHLGSSEVCMKLMESTKVALANLTTLDRNLASLREPTERVRSLARYRSEQDTVPLAESLGEMTLGADDQGKIVKVSVLNEDYWSLAQVLIH